MALASDLGATADQVLTVADLLRHNAAAPATRDKVLLRFETRSWSYEAYFRECCRFGNLFNLRLPPGRPRHVGIIAENTPDYLFAFGGAALAGCGVVTLNLTRRDEHLVRDVQYTDVSLLIVDEDFVHLITDVRAELGLPAERVLVSRRFGPGSPGVRLPADQYDDLESALDGVTSDDPGASPGTEETLTLTFTSGTSGAPKAVPWTHRRILAGTRPLAESIGLRESDVAYMAMPLFHANSLVCNWAPVMTIGATIGMVRRFSAVALVVGRPALRGDLRELRW